MLVLTAVKILFEDMRNVHLAFTATSIFFYALTLLAVSRMIRPKAGAQSDRVPPMPEDRCRAADLETARCLVADGTLVEVG